MRRKAKWSSGVLLAATMLIGMHHATASPAVQRFLEYYDAVQNTEASLSFPQRVAASFLLTQAECRDVKPPAICSRTSSL